jgi:hypothetical protein
MLRAARAAMACVVTAISAAWFPGAHAQVPQRIHYQGYLTSASGQPVNATLSMSFTLYDAASGGTPLWSETQPSVAVTNGSFSVALGSVAPLGLAFDKPYWLGVAVGADAEMTPRQPLAAAPYALGARALAVPSHLLAVNRSGSGIVTSSPAGIACGTTCLAAYDAGILVSLSAVADSSSVFVGWSGACSGTGACQVAMDGVKSVGATFSAPSFTLTTARTGPGTLVSSPAGIYCGVDCNEAYSSGSFVSLAAVPDAGASFGAWSGACSGSGLCQFLMDGNKGVSAAFGYLLSASLTGGAGGTITSVPAGIDCPAGACSAVFSPGTGVTLTETPAEGATFIGWSGAGCSGTSPNCVVSMTQAFSVSATFTFPLTTAVANGSGGTIASEPAGIDCGATCGASFVAGSLVVLTATPSGGAFAGWVGCDVPSGNTCTMTMNAVRSVTANFN